MCCTWLAENTGRKKQPKIRHLRTIAQLCRAISSQLRHVSTIGKNLLNSNTFSTCPRNMVDFSPLTALISQFASWWNYCTDVAHRGQPNFARCLLSPELVHYIYIFGGSCPLTEFCPLQNSLSVQVLCSPILAELMHGTQAVGVSQTLRHDTKNEIKELLQRVPPYLAGWPSRWASAHILV